MYSVCVCVCVAMLAVRAALTDSPLQLRRTPTVLIMIARALRHRRLLQCGDSDVAEALAGADEGGAFGRTGVSLRAGRRHERHVK